MNHQEIREALLAHIASDQADHRALWSAVNQHIDEAADAGEEYFDIPAFLRRQAD